MQLQYEQNLVFRLPPAPTFSGTGSGIRNVGGSGWSQMFKEICYHYFSFLENLKQLFANFNLTILSFCSEIEI